MISKETWQTISYGVSIESSVKFTKSVFSVKAPLLFKLHIRWSGTFVNLKEQFDNMSYRLNLLRLQLSNHKATVTHHKVSFLKKLRVILWHFIDIQQRSTLFRYTVCHSLLIISKYFGNFRYLPVTLGRSDLYVASFEWGELTCSQSSERSVQEPAFPFSGRFLNWPRNSGY